MSDLTSKYIAALLLLFMFVVAFFSMIDDTTIMDEVAHLPAGYSYITKNDMRLNPEHPPLIKDLAGLAIVAFSKISGEQINFPSDIKAWSQDINGQWDFGFDFMYKEGNPASIMLFVGRLPMLLLLMVLGIYLFRWTKELWGKKAALLALFLFSFSPTFIAHGRFVTTDVAAATAVFIATFYFIRWLKNPKLSSLIYAGVFFGLAQLAKFSLFLLVPFFVFLLIVQIIIKLSARLSQIQQPAPFAKDDIFAVPKEQIEIKQEKASKIIWQYLAGFIVILLIGYGLIITSVYYFHVKNYPPEKQKSDTEFILKSYIGGPPSENEPVLSPCVNPSRILRCPAQIAIYLASSKPILTRAFGQYLLGLVMVVQRAAGGNTTYFMSGVSAAGWKTYFPIVYILKEPLTLHILTIIALIIIAYRFLKKEKNPIQREKRIIRRIFSWLSLNFESFSMLMFIALYWFLSIFSPLNIGVRHVLPTFPFIYALVASQIVYWIEEKNSKKVFLFLKYGLVAVLILWQAISVLSIYPSFLAYFNEIIGGPKNGYKYAADSNLDWGQDLARLKIWVEENNINKIYVDYFGGTDIKYVLGDKFQPWWGDRNPSDLKSGDWLAVSATLLQGGRGKPAPGYTDPTGYYNWLNQYEPKTVIGYSIFVYQIP